MNLQAFFRSLVATEIPLADVHGVRRSAWRALLNGCAGYTYGGVWALKWEASDKFLKNYKHPIEFWYAGMALPGFSQMNVVENFFESIPWTTRVPRFSDPAWAEWNDPATSILANSGDSLFSSSPISTARPRGAACSSSSIPPHATRPAGSTRAPAPTATPSRFAPPTANGPPPKNPTTSTGFSFSRKPTKHPPP